MKKGKNKTMIITITPAAFKALCYRARREQKGHGESLLAEFLELFKKVDQFRLKCVAV